MKTKVAIIISVLLASAASQHILNLHFEKGFISTALIVLSIFFGFYITSFAVFASSQYLSLLYGLPRKDDEIYLQNFLKVFQFAMRFALFSIVYLIILYILIENDKTTLISYLAYLIWGILTLNIAYIFQSISRFINIIHEAAIENAWKP